MRFIEELLPLAQLLVELSAPLRHEVVTLLLELAEGDVVHLVHHLDVVEDLDFGWAADA